MTVGRAWRPARRLDGLAQSQIREMRRLALKVGAINMAQGAPAFPAARELKQAAIDAITRDENQYTVTWGLYELRAAVAQMVERRFGIQADPETDVTITCGVTEAIVAALLATVEPGDEVVVIEPAHENYVPAVQFAGGVPRYVTLRPPQFALRRDEVASAISSKTRALLLNTPHNPTGRVFTRAEMLAIADLAHEHDLLVVTDEIYDYILYDGRQHVAPATLNGMAERTIMTGGISKIYAVTGWRLGYVVAPASLSAAVRTVHDYLTICAPTPFQHAALTALAFPDSYYEEVRADYHDRRDRMMAALEAGGFAAQPPEGAYYVLADFGAWNFAGTAEDFTRFLIEEVGVAVVPGSAFYYSDPTVGDGVVRFAFATTVETIEEVGIRLQRGFTDAGPTRSAEITDAGPPSLTEIASS